MNETQHTILYDMERARRNALKSLAGYKFLMFGYWAAQWVAFNKLLTADLRHANPFQELVKLARKEK